MRRRKPAWILVVMLCALSSNAIAEVVATRLMAFDSFVRIPFPDNLDVEIIAEDRAAARQKLHVSRQLKPAERQEVERTLRATDHVRAVKWEGAHDVELEFASVRASAVEITPGLWASVVRRPSAFPVADLIGAQTCEALFPKLEQPELIKQRASLCSGSRAWVAAPGTYQALSREQEYVADVLRMFTGPQPPPPERLLRWATEESDGSRDDQASVLLLHAVMLIDSDQDVAGLVALSQLATTNALPDALKDALRVLAQATFERILETKADAHQIDAALDFWKRFKQWDTAQIDEDTKLNLATWFRAESDFGSAIRQYVDLLNRGHEEDPKVLGPLADAYSEAGQGYRAYATRKFLAELKQ